MHYVPYSTEAMNTIGTPVTPAMLSPIAEPAAFGISKKCEVRLREVQKMPGTWRNILLTDPPCSRVNTTALLRVSCRPAAFSHVYDLEIAADGAAGVTIGTMLDALSDHSIRSGLHQSHSKVAAGQTFADQVGDLGGNPKLRRITIVARPKEVVLASEKAWEQVKARST